MELPYRDIPLRADRSSPQPKSSGSAADAPAPPTTLPYATSRLRRAHTVAQSAGNTSNNSMRRRNNLESSVKASMSRDSRPLRVRDSHEMLQQSSSLKRCLTERGPRNAPPNAGVSATNGASHFTVGSVGQNGKIFLRPIRNPSIKDPRPLLQQQQQQQRQQQTQRQPARPLSPADQSQPQNQHRFPFPSITQHGRGQIANDPSRWSNSQLSELHPSLIREESVVDDGESVFTESARPEYHPRQNRPRARSFSTISEHPSTSSIRPRGEYHRIVIDRSDERQRQDIPEEPITRPALEVPIPHYRLGLPQSMAAGSGALPSSVYTPRPSTDLPGESVNSPLSNLYQSGSWAPDRPSFVSSMLSGVGPALEMGPAPAPAEASVLYEATEPIEPSVFEDLVSDMDDESVVRYVPGTKDVSAASPARIVAEISSESFMDYELVSDFFLTFRSYLSSSHLLALLLARLKWAINRWQDDGRIIRIRTFAALRHWMLNYFIDDFVANYDLRSFFCDTINSMYAEVKARETGGASDLKILVDLKRCWHGKCAMCWDSSELSAAYYNPDNPIVPGGVFEVTEGKEPEPQPIAVQTEKAIDNDASASTENTQDAAGTRHHHRNASAATARSIPVSTHSDNSFHVTSCSFPPKSSKGVSIPLQAPQPVPLLPVKYRRGSQGPPPSSSASKRSPFFGHAHKRSGSFSDSVRDDQSPLSLAPWGIATSQEVLDPGSLIRGTLYQPAESYMTTMAPPSPPLSLSSVTPALERQNTVDATSRGAPSNSGVRTLIGSIRKAINGAKQGGTSRHTRGASASPWRGKTSAVPNKVAFGADYYRDRKTAAMAAKKQTRIDTLCDEVLKEYRQAISEQEENRSDQPAQPAPEELSTLRLQAPPTTRVNSSGLTMGSESIVIVDDTGLNIPMVSGANGEPMVDLEQASGLHPADAYSTPKTGSLHVPSYNRSTHRDDEYSLQIFYDGTTDAGQSLEPPKPPETFYDSDSTGSVSAERGPSFHKRASPSLRLRKYASFQSDISRISKRRSGNDSEVLLVADANTLHTNSKKSTLPILRRRPGGDLRKMQNGRKPLLSCMASRSSASVVDSEGTAPASRAAGSRPETSFLPPNPRYSLLQTNSSQDVKRSFEAAIAKFAQIPDDDDGGVESTLLKLEGKWEAPEGDEGSVGDASGRDLRPQRRNVPVVRQHDGSQRQQTLYVDPVGYSHVRGRLVPPRPYSDSVGDSEESFSSIPLLERGLSDDSMKKSPLTSNPVTSRLQLSATSSHYDTSEYSSHPSMDMVKETESIRRIPRDSTQPIPARPKTALGRLSQLSSETSVIDRREVDGRLSTDTTNVGRSSSSFGIPPHPLAQPPSPPMTIQNPRSVTSCATPLNPVLAQAHPLTPDPSPSRRYADPDASRFIGMQQDVLSRSEFGQQQRQIPTNQPHTDHVPFILSCGSRILAQQLTLVEMAALSEIDWRDLVEMRWTRGAPTTLSWVQFLTSEDHRGIDLVVGRFNLMVKWVLSEIVLTRDINERVATVTKFIHTAEHAKRISNYATMLQIAIALSSTVCSRLEKTWSLVSAEDRRLLKDMEALIQPVRNFHDLRVEMETANLQEGCIPFVGLYVHDLTYNAQKPPHVPTGVGTPGSGEALLINFKRHRTAARIVKNLLKLINASTKYAFQPVRGVIEWCLWIGALGEEEIQERSRALD